MIFAVVLERNGDVSLRDLEDSSFEKPKCSISLISSLSDDEEVILKKMIEEHPEIFDKITRIAFDYGSLQKKIPELREQLDEFEEKLPEGILLLRPKDKMN